MVTVVVTTAATEIKNVYEYTTDVIFTHTHTHTH